jgi:hypothetical protein
MRICGMDEGQSGGVRARFTPVIGAPETVATLNRCPRCLIEIEFNAATAAALGLFGSFGRQFVLTIAPAPGAT